MGVLGRFLIVAIKLLCSALSLVFLPAYLGFPLLAAMGAVEGSRLRCKKCGATELRRVSRYGWWQQFASRWFQLYPWECVFCRSVRLYRKCESRSNRPEREDRAASVPPAIPEEISGLECSAERVA